MPDTTATPEPPTSPLMVLRAALRWAALDGYQVTATTDHGVVCVSKHARDPWRKDPFQSAISPVGAAVLMLQPPQTFIWSAIAEVLGGSIPFAEGVQDGIAKVSPRAQAFGQAWRRYLDGLEVGYQVRTLVILRAWSGK